jgi:hypothetical protein
MVFFALYFRYAAFRDIDYYAIDLTYFHFVFIYSRATAQQIQPQPDSIPLPRKVQGHVLSLHTETHTHFSI